MYGNITVSCWSGFQLKKTLLSLTLLSVFLDEEAQSATPHVAILFSFSGFTSNPEIVQLSENIWPSHSPLATYMLVQPMFRNSWTIRKILCISTNFNFLVVAHEYRKRRLCWKRIRPHRRLNILMITGNYALSGEPHCMQHSNFAVQIPYIKKRAKKKLL